MNKLADCLEKIILMNDEDWNVLSNNSKKIAYEKFSDEKYFEIFKNIYRGEI